jgi:hypothetical protein
MRIIISIIAALFLCAGAVAQDTADSLYERQALEQAMGLLNLNINDITFRNDYTEIDSFRLRSVSDLMHHPYGMIQFAEELRDSCAGRNPEPVLQLAFTSLGKINQNQRGRTILSPADETIATDYHTYYNSADLNRLLAMAYDYLYHYLPAAKDSLLAGLSEDEISFLLNEFKITMLEDTADEFRSIEELDSLGNIEEKYLEEFTEFGHKINKDYLIYGGMQAASVMYREINSVQKLIESGEFTIDEILSDTVIRPRSTGLARYLGHQEGWAVGSTEDDIYQGDYYFIIDFGGDDRYELSYDPEEPHSTIIIDLSGNDIYNARTEFVIGSGCLSAGLLFDMAGDDIYNGGNFACGSGYFGFGLLYDAAGHDRYYSDTQGQGAATFGIGVLFDGDGSDIYSSAVYSQGFGATEGCGLIVDAAGNDNYSAGSKYKDYLRFDDHYLSLSQGFAYGMIPFMSGGIGAIVDLAGNDNYITDIYGQGCSYWWGLGLLYDSSGNDQYLSYQYGQGTGVHMSLGLLMDECGRDFYHGKGLMQGVGHDYACGILLDRNGDDIFQADDLSQGAGSANGTGILINNRGDDAYFVIKKHSTQGYGNPRRDFGSIGLFLDLNGEDHYDGNGSDDSYWKTDSKWGAGYDWNFIEVDSAGE